MESTTMTYNTSNTPNTGTTSGGMKETADQVRGAVENTASDIRNKAQDALGNVQGIDVRQQFQEHPWLTLGALVGVGYLLGRMSDNDGRQSRQGHQSQQNWQPWQSQQNWQGQHGYAGAMEQVKHYESSQREGMAGKLGRRVFGSLGTLEELYAEKLQDLYDAEHQILMALPMMIEAASSHELKRAFDMHLHQTRGQIARLEQVFRRAGMEPKGKPCTAMKGLLAEGKETMAMRADPEVKDAALIAAAQGVEHHEIAAYGTLRTWARQLGQHDAAQLLQQTLNEEEHTDRHLTQIAERTVNVQAAR
jgi:ferritin-like metal-binding protein YciE